MMMTMKTNRGNLRLSLLLSDSLSSRVTYIPRHCQIPGISSNYSEVTLTGDILRSYIMHEGTNMDMLLVYYRSEIETENSASPSTIHVKMHDPSRNRVSKPKQLHRLTDDFRVNHPSIPQNLPRFSVSDRRCEPDNLPHILKRAR